MNLLGLSTPAPSSKRFNIAPSHFAPVCRVLPDSKKRTLDEMRWGLLPSWAKRGNGTRAMINARAETAAVKPFFRDALKKRRCLVPATGFYEWAGSGRRKRPIYFYRRDHAPFAFAGMWESQPDDRKPLETFCLLTCAANDFLKPHHHRMPVILAAEHFESWLDPAADPRSLQPLLETKPWPDMTFHPVSRSVNDPSNDHPSCTEPEQALDF